MINSWHLQALEYPAYGTDAERLKFLVQYAILAPSSHNTQPWLFEIRPQHLNLRADRTRALPVVDPHDRALEISCGAALGFLIAAMRRFGHTGEIQILPNYRDPDLLARVELGASWTPTLQDRALFEAMVTRRTNRSRYDDRPLPPELIHSLSSVACHEGAKLIAVGEAKAKEGIAALIAEGDRVQGSDPRFRRELASWIHPNRSRSRDGIPGYALGMGDWSSYLGPVLIRTFDWGEGQAAKDRQLALGSPLLVMIGTENDDSAAWLASGQALARVLLLLEAAGGSASFLNQPVEVPSLRPKLARMLGFEGHPQLLLRMGYGPSVKATPRRPVEEVLAGS
jgi:hypothetical protein